MGTLSYAAQAVYHVNRDLTKGLYQLDMVRSGIIDGKNGHQCIAVVIYYSQKVLNKVYMTVSIFDLAEGRWYHDADNTYEKYKDRAWWLAKLTYIDMIIQCLELKINPSPLGNNWDLNRYFVGLEWN